MVEPKWILKQEKSKLTHNKIVFYSFATFFAMSKNGSSHDYIRSGALLRCDKGTVPCPLSVPSRTPTIAGKSWCNTNDRDPLVNQLNFGICTVTQKPCPLTCNPLQWQNVQTSVDVAGRPALLECSYIMCTVGGRITFLDSGQLT